MTNLIKMIKIERISFNGSWDRIEMSYKRDEYMSFPIFESILRTNRSEDEAVSVLLDRFVIGLSFNGSLEGIDLDNLRSKVIQGFHQLRENDWSGSSRQILELSFVLEVHPEPHLSCKMNQTEDSADQVTGENEISQSELQQNLAIIDKDTKVKRFFEENICSVCLRSYKMILDEKLHIVIPSCGHPLCCVCADKLLVGEKKECPQCRRNLTADSFNLMKFNADLDNVFNFRAKMLK